MDVTCLADKMRESKHPYLKKNMFSLQYKFRYSGKTIKTDSSSIKVKSIN